jgi:hypothetical protein
MFSCRIYSGIWDVLTLKRVRDALTHESMCPCNATCGTVLTQILAALRNKYWRFQTAACSVWYMGVRNTNRPEGYAHLRSTQEPSLT